LDVVDIRRMVRTLKYSQMEQAANPKTGERFVPPSIKFAVFLVLVVFVGTMLFLVGQQLPAQGDAGRSLGDGSASTDPVDNNTTQPDEPATEVPPARSAGPAVFDILTRSQDR
jgi:hypothetical protein